MRRWQVALIFAVHMLLTFLFLALTLYVQRKTAPHVKAMTHNLQACLYPAGWEEMTSTEADMRLDVYHISRSDDAYDHANQMLANYWRLKTPHGLVGRVLVAGEDTSGVAGLDRIDPPTMTATTYKGLNKTGGVLAQEGPGEGTETHVYELQPGVDVFAGPLNRTAPHNKPNTTDGVVPRGFIGFIWTVDHLDFDFTIDLLDGHAGTLFGDVCDRWIVRVTYDFSKRARIIVTNAVHPSYRCTDGTDGSDASAADDRELEPFLFALLIGCALVSAAFEVLWVCAGIDESKRARRRLEEARRARRQQHQQHQQRSRQHQQHQQHQQHRRSPGQGSSGQEQGVAEGNTASAAATETSSGLPSQIPIRGPGMGGESGSGGSGGSGGGGDGGGGSGGDPEPVVASSFTPISREDSVDMFGVRSDLDEVADRVEASLYRHGNHSSGDDEDDYSDDDDYTDGAEDDDCHDNHDDNDNAAAADDHVGDGDSDSRDMGAVDARRGEEQQRQQRPKRRNERRRRRAKRTLWVAWQQYRGTMQLSAAIGNGCVCVYCVLFMAFGGPSRGDYRLSTAMSLLMATGNMFLWGNALWFSKLSRQYNTLIMTLKQGMQDSAPFLLGTLPMYFAFFVFGTVMFGSHSTRFRTVEATATTLFAVMNGDEMRPTFVDLIDHFPTSFSMQCIATIYLASFVLVNLNVILIMFLVILRHSYDLVAERAEEAGGAAASGAQQRQPTDAARTFSGAMGGPVDDARAAGELPAPEGPIMRRRLSRGAAVSPLIGGILTNSQWWNTDDRER